MTDFARSREYDKYKTDIELKRSYELNEKSLVQIVERVRGYCGGRATIEVQLSNGITIETGSIEQLLSDVAIEAYPIASIKVSGSRLDGPPASVVICIHTDFVF